MVLSGSRLTVSFKTDDADTAAFALRFNGGDLVGVTDARTGAVYSAVVDLNEYIVACYGTTEYPEDMTSLTLTCKGKGEEKKIDYAYKCREAEIEGADSVEAVIPPIETKVSMRTSDEKATGYIREGYAFSPMFTLGYKMTLKDKEVVSTWLKLEKAN